MEYNDRQDQEENGGGDNAQVNPIQQQQRERVQIGALRLSPTMHDIAQIELWFVQMVQLESSTQR